MNSFRDSWPERGVGEMVVREREQMGLGTRGEASTRSGQPLRQATPLTQMSLQSGAHQAG